MTPTDPASMRSEHKSGCSSFRVIGYTSQKDRADYTSSDQPIYGHCDCGVALPSPVTGSQLVPVGGECPKCGAEYKGTSFRYGNEEEKWGMGDKIYFDYYECKSLDFGKALGLQRTDACRIRELESTVSKITADLERVGRERDAAISLLGQYNSNQGGLRLNGKAIGWHRDPIAGFVAGIGGSKAIYPTILAAIRAALAALDQPAEGEKGNGNGT